MTYRNTGRVLSISIFFLGLLSPVFTNKIPQFKYIRNNMGSDGLTYFVLVLPALVLSIITWRALGETNLTEKGYTKKICGISSVFSVVCILWLLTGDIAGVLIWSTLVFLAMPLIYGIGGEILFFFVKPFCGFDPSEEHKTSPAKKKTLEELFHGSKTTPDDRQRKR